jgi:hypothetical protein
MEAMMDSTRVDAVGTEIRPFEVDVPQADLDELRRRIQAEGPAFRSLRQEGSTS